MKTTRQQLRRIIREALNDQVRPLTSEEREELRGETERLRARRPQVPQSQYGEINDWLYNNYIEKLDRVHVDELIDDWGSSPFANLDITNLWGNMDTLEEEGVISSEGSSGYYRIIGEVHKMKITERQLRGFIRRTLLREGKGSDAVTYAIENKNHRFDMFIGDSRHASAATEQPDYDGYGDGRNTVRFKTGSGYAAMFEWLADNKDLIVGDGRGLNVKIAGGQIKIRGGNSNARLLEFPGEVKRGLELDDEVLQDLIRSAGLEG